MTFRGESRIVILFEEEQHIRRHFGSEAVWSNFIMVLSFLWIFIENTAALAKRLL